MKGEVEGYRKQLSAVRAEQAPWEAQLAELSSRMSVASAERDLLLKKQTDAEKRFKVFGLPLLSSASTLASPALITNSMPSIPAASRNAVHSWEERCM